MPEGETKQANVSRRKFIAVGGGSAAMGSFSSPPAAEAAARPRRRRADRRRNRPKAPAAARRRVRQGRHRHPDYALTLEYLEADFYAGRQSGKLKGKVLEVAQVVRRRGDAARRRPTARSRSPAASWRRSRRPKFPLNSAKSVPKLAGTVENLGAAAYLGQAAEHRKPEMLAAALAIHSVEGRHAAVLNTLLGKSITPDGAFAKRPTSRPSSRRSSRSSSAETAATSERRTR